LKKKQAAVTKVFFLKRSNFTAAHLPWLFKPQQELKEKVTRTEIIFG
jgi:hypothetical protein